MLNKIIIAFLAGIILKKSINLDLFYIGHFLLVSILIAIIFFSFDKTINDIIKSVKDIFQFKMSFISLGIVCTMSFTIGLFYINNFTEAVSCLSYTKTKIMTEGIILNRERQIDKEVLTVKVEEGSAIYTENKEEHTLADYDMYLKVPVSLFQEFDLYEKLQIKGETTGLYNNIFTQKRPLFLRYETDTFLYENIIYLNQYNLKLDKLSYKITLSQEIYKSLFDLNLYFINIIKRKMSEPYASLATGITLGETSSLSKKIKDDFKNSGLIHLMVLSGTNITLVIGAIWIGTRRMRVRDRVLISLTLAWLFIFMTGLTAPAVRAGLMGSLALLALSSGKKYSVVSALLLALFIMTLLDPMSLLYSPSLHLSFLACFALFIVTPIFVNFLQQKFTKDINLKRINKNVITIFALIISMTATTTLYILGLSGQVGLLGGPATLLAEPLVAISMLMTFLTLFSYHLLYPLGEILTFIFSYLNTLSTMGFLFLAEFTASNFTTLKLEISKNFVIIFYSIFIFYFSYRYYKLEDRELSENELKDLEGLNKVSDKYLNESILFR